MSPDQARRRADAVMELHESGELEEALSEVEELLAALDGTVDLSDPVLRESLYTARFERAVLLTEIGDLDAAAAAYALAARTPADLDDPDQRHEIALALLNQGICLDAVEDHAAAEAVYAEVVTRFEHAEDPVTADQVARARVNRAATVLARGRAEEAAALAAATATDLDPLDVRSSEQHVMALRLRAAALAELDRLDEAVAVLDLRHTATAEDPSTRAQIAAAAGDHAALLSALGQHDQALTILTEVLEHADTELDLEVLDVLDELRMTRERLAAG